jgi:hypothetical protein
MDNQQIKDLEKELKLLKENKQKEEKIVQLKRQIKAEKFAQTKTGKVINSIGKVLVPPQQKQNRKLKKKIKQKKYPDLEETMKNLDELVNKVV